MAENHNVEFKISAVDAATRVLQDVGRGFDKLGATFGKVQALVGGTTFALAIKAITDATIEAERASARLDTTLKTTGFSAGVTRKELDQIAESLKRSTAFDDDDIRKGLSSLLRFRDVAGDVFRDAAGLAVDLAAALDTDVNSAFQRLGRALEDPEKGLRALREAGINVSLATERVKQVMEETGDVAAAQKIILDELTKSIGGAAAGENVGVYGSTKALGKAWDDLLKSIGQTPAVSGTSSVVLDTITMQLTKMKNLVEAPWSEKFLHLLNLQFGLKALPGRELPAPSQSEKDEAERGRAGAESDRLQAERKKQLAEQEKKIMEERAEREKRLREEDIKGWIAHADAIIQEDFRVAEALAKAEQEEVALREKRGDDEAERARRANQAIAERTFAIMEANLTEVELLNSRLVQEQEILDAALENRLISEETHLQQMMLLNKRYQDDRTRLEDAEIKKRYGIAQVYRQLDLASAGSFLGQMAQLMETNSKTMFEFGKKAAIAETIIKTYEGAQAAFTSLARIPYIGPILGAAAAAAAIAVGMARVQKIRSTQFGATAASPVFSASPVTGIPSEPIGPVAPPPAIATAAPRGPEINVTIVGNESKTLDYKQMVEEVIPLFEEVVASGASKLNLTFA